VLWLIAAALGTVAVPAQTAEWWWVAGDSGDAAAVFADAGSVRRSGDQASVRAVRIARDGAASIASWSGRCSDVHADDQTAAIARFACGSDADHMQQAAMLPGLTPAEAARAIFGVAPTNDGRILSAKLWRAW
jgi:hypothetical protein